MCRDSSKSTSFLHQNTKAFVRSLSQNTVILIRINGARSMDGYIWSSARICISGVGWPHIVEICEPYWLSSNSSESGNSWLACVPDISLLCRYIPRCLIMGAKWLHFRGRLLLEKNERNFHLFYEHMLTHSILSSLLGMEIFTLLYFLKFFKNPYKNNGI